MSTLFVANRGEIAARIIRSAREAGFRCAVARPDVDEGLPYVDDADVVIDLESPRSFSDPAVMVDAAVAAGADLLHPGYGFLSESADFARAVQQAGIVFVGPGPDIIETMGDKANARARAVASGLAVPAGSLGPISSVREARLVAAEAGFPLMVKAVAGGGGIGMAVAADESSLEEVVTAVMGRAASVFGDDRVIVEQYLSASKHVEVQVMGLPDGRVIALAERDCSVQRRHQKVVEESPSPAVDRTQRARLRSLACQLAEGVGYQNAGTVEFILDSSSGEAYFLEMNTRLQVEHPVTEAVHGVDLVRWQLEIAQGSSRVPDGLLLEPRGHAVELRLYAEDSERFLPRPGKISRWTLPSGKDLRVDSGYADGAVVTPFFDPLLAKIIALGGTRDEAIDSAVAAVRETRVDGPGNNLVFLDRVLRTPEFREGTYDTNVVTVMAARRHDDDRAPAE
ncbi:biotin carboxylase N-terminal domain-containing protein [Aeromicrobium halocynthiae]|uniref:biotin carboxylase n=1 Tax=Aeromicrobium halocynthiae TaxID=560557 RepID=A0ABN2VVX2_9ACTN